MFTTVPHLFSSNSKNVFPTFNMLDGIIREDYVHRMVYLRTRHINLRTECESCETTRLRSMTKFKVEIMKRKLIYVQMCTLVALLFVGSLLRGACEFFHFAWCSCVLHRWKFILSSNNEKHAKIDLHKALPLSDYNSCMF